jgi:hypothetical protein
MLTKQLTVTVTVLNVITDHKSLVLFNIIALSKKQTWNFEKAILFKALRVINCRAGEMRVWEAFSHFIWENIFSYSRNNWDSCESILRLKVIDYIRSGNG